MTSSVLTQLLDPIKKTDASPSARASIYLYNHLKQLENEMVREIGSALDERSAALMFYVSPAKYQQLYPIDCRQLGSLIFGALKAPHDHNCLYKICQGATLISLEALWEDDFLVVLRVDRQDLSAFLSHDAVTLVQTNKYLNQEASKVFGNSFEVRVGYASILGSGDYLTSRINDALTTARKRIKHYVSLQTTQLPSEFRGLIDRSAFNILYQPIVSLRTGHALGWESLIRGPRESYFHSPDAIFSFAEESNLLPEIEKLSWRLALNQAGSLGPEQKLFLNVHPRTFENDAFFKADAVRLVEEAGLTPQKVVIEITERHDIVDICNVKRLLKECRDEGFLVAVDDVGSGFSCLHSIAEIRPDFIKLSTSLVQGIHQDRAKSILLETFANFAEKVGCSIIAEGIEEESDLKALMQIGIQNGQGYFFSRPEFPKPVVNGAVEAVVRRLRGHAPNGWRYPLTIGEIADEAVAVREDTKIEVVKDFFEKNENVSGLVISRENTGHGLIMRQHLDRHLGTRYGAALYFDKPISKLMDPTPLTVPEDMSIDSVAQQAMNREKIKHGDYIIVQGREGLKGIVSIQTILDALTKVRIEMAKGANPLTGLPGNNAFEQEVIRRKREGTPFSFVFVDLDHFKSYNDRYGFERGDQVLLFAANLMRAVLKKFGSGKDFLGHIGGDDYYMFVEKNLADGICEKIIRYFDRLIPSYYDGSDRAAKAIRAVDREGMEKTFPFVSVSMAVIDMLPDDTADLSKTIQTLVDLKHYAKSLPGSKYVRDRRRTT